jgi:hypothetical protein
MGNLVLFNGGIYSFVFPKALVEWPGLEGLYHPVNVSGLLALFLALTMALVEWNPLKRKWIYSIYGKCFFCTLYFVLGILLIWQYTLTVPSSFLLLTTVTKGLDIWQDLYSSN